MRIMEQLGFFYALGVVIVFIAAAALGRIASVPAGIRVVEPVTETVPGETAPMDAVSAGTLPARTRAEAAAAKHARGDETGAVPAEDTTRTIG
jgi:hypothetical protein